MHGIKRSHLSENAKLAKIKKDESKILHYRKLNDQVLSGKELSIYNDATLDMTTKLLGLNPELYTVWNYRRDILTNFKFKELKETDLHGLFSLELQFALAQLMKYPKSYWIWNHRMWCLKLDDLSDWLNELKLIDKFFQSDSRNYHVWQYRRFVIDSIKSTKLTNREKVSIDYDEFQFTTKMINKDISNYSAWHNRSKLIEKLFISSPSVSNTKDNYLAIFNNKSKYDFLVLELEMIKTAFYTDPEDSSVWIYMKWLFSDYFLLELCDEQVSSLISTTVQNINELNELEVEDNGDDNQWCLKTNMYLLQKLYTLPTSKTSDVISKIQSISNKLIKSDPMRTKRYDEFMTSVSKSTTSTSA